MTSNNEITDEMLAEFADVVDTIMGLHKYGCFPYHSRRWNERYRREQRLSNRCV